MMLKFIGRVLLWPLVVPAIVLGFLAAAVFAGFAYGSELLDEYVNRVTE